jgi:hypothetical protein
MVSRVWELWHDMNGGEFGGINVDRGFARWPTHAIKPHEWVPGAGVDGLLTIAQTDEIIPTSSIDCGIRVVRDMLLTKQCGHRR